MCNFGSQENLDYSFIRFSWDLNLFSFIFLFHQIHVTCLDFTLLSAFAPFWVYNDMTARKWWELCCYCREYFSCGAFAYLLDSFCRFDKGSWLLPLSLVPFVGPALYILLRPPLPTLPASVSSTTSEPKWCLKFISTQSFMQRDFHNWLWREGAYSISNMQND